MSASNNKRNYKESKGNKYSKYSEIQNINDDVKEEDYIDLDKEDSNSIEVVGVEYSQGNTQTINYGKLREHKKYQCYTKKKVSDEPLELISISEEKDIAFKNANNVKITGTKLFINFEDSSNNDKNDRNKDEPTKPLVPSKNEKMLDKKAQEIYPTNIILKNKNNKKCK